MSLQENIAKAIDLGAVKKASLLYPKQNDFQEDQVFSIHFFDLNMVEIFYYIPDIKEFSSGKFVYDRLWGPEALKNLVLEELF